MKNMKGVDIFSKKAKKSVLRPSSRLDFGVKNRNLKWPRIKKLVDDYPERCAGRFVVIDENKFRFRPLLYVP